MEYTVNKSEFVTAVSEELKCTKTEASRCIDGILKVVKNTLQNGEELRLVGFGTFKVSHVPAKEVRNPQNGNKIPVPASKRPKFIAGKDLKKAVNS